MKYFLLLCLLCFSCNSPQPTEQKTDTTSGAGTEPPVDNGSKKDGVTPVSEVHDTIIWIGKSARWKMSPAEIFDGSYDSTTSLFLACGNTKAQHVDKSQIDYDLVNNCDSAFSARVRVMLYNRIDTSYHALPHTISVIPSTETSKPLVQLQHGTETITLNPRQAARVQAAAVQRRLVYLQKQKLLQK
jgi:hypothetical protein